MRTWARPDVPYKRWWADLKPLLSPEAEERYSYTDPQAIPPLKVLDGGTEASREDPYVDTVYFETSHGRFGVDVSRPRLDGEWIGESIIFPDGHSILQ